MENPQELHRPLTIAFNLTELLKNSKKVEDYQKPLYMIMLLKRLYNAGHLIIVWSDKNIGQIRQILRKFDLMQYVHLIDKQSDPEVIPDVSFDNHEGISKLVTIKF